MRRGPLVAPIILALIVALGGCGGRERTPDDYVESAIEIMDAHGLFAEGPRWEESKAEARERLREIDSLGAAHGLVDRLVEVAGGPHSRLMSSADVDRLSASAADLMLPVVETLEEGISVISLPPLPGDDEDAVSAYMATGREAVEKAMNGTGCGWIVDLGRNSGGNAIPMLSVVSPLLGEGRVFGFEDRDGAIEWVENRDGTLSYPGVLDSDPERTSDLPVAVVTSGMTASAAELVAVAFDGREGSASFGRPTAGYTTANEAFEMEDGSLLVLSVAHYVTRDGSVVTGPLPPDDEADSHDPAAAIDDARAWLARECAV